MRLLLFFYFMYFLSTSVQAAHEDDFVIQIDTNLYAPIVFDDGLPRFIIDVNSEEYAYNYNVDCNDDGELEGVSITGDFECELFNLGGHGEYTIRIKDNVGDGTGFPHFNTSLSVQSERNAKMITHVLQWGNGKWQSMKNAFRNAENMIVSANDIPDLSEVNDVSRMFALALLADPDVSGWDVSNITNMSQMFHSAKSADPDVKNWDVSKVSDMSYMFALMNVADPDVSNWDVSNVTNMQGMFATTMIANPDVSNWDVSSVLNMREMFIYSVKANPDVSNWDVSNVTNMIEMFYQTQAANPNVSNWDVSNVTNMKRMFTLAQLADPNVSNWDVSSVTSMEIMFAISQSAKPDVSAWDVGNVINMTDMFKEISLPPRLYDEILINFSEQVLQDDVTFGAGNSFYCEGEAARDQIIANHSWQITDAGLNCGSDIAIENIDYDEFIGVSNDSQITFEVVNNGYQNVANATVEAVFANNPELGLVVWGWACAEIAGQATCPASNGMGDLSELIDLEIGDRLRFTVGFGVPAGADGQVGEIATSLSMEIPDDDIYPEDNVVIESFVVTSQLFANGFE